MKVFTKLFFTKLRKLDFICVKITFYGLGDFVFQFQDIYIIFQFKLDIPVKGCTLLLFSGVAGSPILVLSKVKHFLMINHFFSENN